jgi:3-hydroxyisobutyrate dehydrogenase-like beta-hydroxyacid dehydrogenase
MTPEHARRAEGIMLCAGPAALHERLAPELSSMTGRLWYLGEEPGRAAAFKLFGNAMFFTVVAGLSDVLAVARGAGVEAADVLELFKTVNAAGQIAARGPRMLSGDYTPTFELSMARKDVRLMIETAFAGAPLAVLPAIAARMDALIAQGHGGDDLAALVAGVLPPATSPHGSG